MANEGLNQLSLVQNVSLTGSAQTSTAMRSFGAEYLFLYMKFTKATQNISAFQVQVSDNGGTTWLEMPIHTRGTISATENWRVTVRCGTPDRRFRASMTGAGTDTAAVFQVRGQFNRSPKPVLVT